MIPPNHKQMWCDGLPVRMRLLGWSEEACRAVEEQVHKVRHLYTGRAWYAYTVAVDRFLNASPSREAQHLVAYFPRRQGVDRNLNIQA